MEDYQLINSFAGKSSILDAFGIFFASYVAILVVVFVLYLIYRERNSRRRLFLIFFILLSLLLSYGIIDTSIHHFFFRDRPFVAHQFTPLVPHAADASFPSSHAVVFFTLATAVFLKISRRWGTWLFITASLIGLARIFAGLHYPLDVIAGALIGVVSVLLVSVLLHKYENRQAEHLADTTIQ